MIVMLGPDAGPFQRLSDWTGRWAARYEDEWELQVLDDASRGDASEPGQPAAEALDGADLVVCGADDGVVQAALDAGHLPVVVPRSVDLGEADDDAQLRLARTLALQGRAELADSEDAFLAATVTLAYLPRPRSGKHAAPATAEA